MQRAHIIRRSVMVAVTFWLPVQVLAQGDEPLDEITVTADYRERPVTEIPASITILDAEAVSSRATQHFEELITQLANLNWSGDGHRARYIQIRGIGELAQYQGAPNPSIGFVVDDIDFSGIGSIATLWDIERIEVLRGPQGTRYGANALAGLIYIQSASPSEDFAGKLQVLAGSDDALGGGIAVGGPIGDNGAGYRLSAHHYQSNGFRDNPYLGRQDTNGRDETSLRARFDWGAGDNWDFRLTGMLSDVDNGYDAFAIDNSLTVLSNRPGKDAQRSAGAALNIDWTGSQHVRITSVTSYVDSDIDFSFDADWGNDDAWSPVIYDYVSLNDRRRTTLNREIRAMSTEDGRIFAGTTDWLVGFYFNQLDENLTTINQGEYFDPGFNFADSLDDRLDSKFEAMSMAVFGQLEFDIGESGRLTIGTRIERRGVEYTDTSGLNLSPNDPMVGGEIAYNHSFSERTSGFVRFSRGYKGGGFNLGLVPAGSREFAQEYLWSLEMGARSSLLDDKLFLNGTIFYNVRDDQQVETSFQIDPNDPASFVFFTANAAEGEALGLEVEVSWLPIDNLELTLNLGLLNATFDNFVTPLVDASGRDQAHAPAYTFAAGAAYNHESGWFGRVDISAMDEFYFDVSHDQVSDAYTIASARLGYQADRWTAQLWVRNAFDERYAVRGFFFGNEPPLFPPTLYIRQGDPRQAGITIDWRF